MAKPPAAPPPKAPPLARVPIGAPTSRPAAFNQKLVDKIAPEDESRREQSSDFQLRVLQGEDHTDNLLEEFQGLLKIDKNGLDEEYANYPDVIFRVNIAHELAISRRDAAKKFVEVTRARVEVAIRREAAAQQDVKKPTETEFANRTTLHSDVVAAEEELLKRGGILGRLSAMRDAMKQRSYALSELAAMWVAGYYADSGHKPKGAHDVADRKAANNREQMDRMRQQGRTQT